MNKKAGDFSAGKLFIAIVLYFFFFIMIVYGANNIQAETELSTSSTVEIEGLEFEAIIGQSYCLNPRYAYDAKTAIKTEYSSTENDRLFCEESIGIMSETTCNSIEGCSWENVTSGFWFWETVEYASCIGDINASYYGIEMTEPILGRPRVKPHDNTGIWETYTPFSDPSVCEHPEVIQNKTLCNMFSCTWTKITADNSFNDANKIYSTVSDVFTFRYDFGFENAGTRALVNFIFVVLPLLALIMSLYYMLPLLH